ncbi:50 kDa Cathepsin B [Spodoptera frugiperda ascovirus 1a]|uniref:50 kDa Cathepsin B n=1 Tax=Spodoptera frugiperda ascovirus 1a TaxID=113370 RepID=Q0E4Y7_SFAVA|nr:50 kDa Cathepsin B [Spodoptera frugiperda ascovirus 1a]CAL44714.2 50 kDa Cathepsin B [Spodoptera frugiperda ascovirus 1a]
MDGMIYNTDIRIPLDAVTEPSGSSIVIPDYWDWSTIDTKNDSNDVLRKKSMITKPLNQYKCGSCWAFSAATMLSDTLVISGLVDSANDAIVSPTAMMRRANKFGCAGGSTYALLKHMKSQTVGFAAGGRCTDYSWCETNSVCRTNRSELHFETTNERANYLNSLVPTPRCENSIPIAVTGVYVLTSSIDKTSNRPSSDTVNVYNAIKTHLLTKGTVGVSMVLYENFLNGKFSRINGGVYQERIDYASSIRTGSLKFFPKNVDDSMIRGSHSVVIVGWGTSRVIDHRGNTVDMPYWKCRNSWGTKWGENGYFKIAAYPYNTKVALLMTIEAVLHGEQIKVGGSYYVNLQRLTDAPKSYCIIDGNMTPIPPAIVDAPNAKRNSSMLIVGVVALLSVSSFRSGLPPRSRTTVNNKRQSSARQFKFSHVQVLFDTTLAHVTIDHAVQTSELLQMLGA